MLQGVAGCCRVLQGVAGCCRVLQCAAVCCIVLRCVAVCCSVLQCVAVCCSVSQCVAVCCSVMQGAVCCRVLPIIKHGANGVPTGIITTPKLERPHMNESLLWKLTREECSRAFT